MPLSAQDIRDLYDLGDRSKSNLKKETASVASAPSDPILGQNVIKCFGCRFTGYTGTICPHHPSSNPKNCEFNNSAQKEKPRRRRGSPNKV
jgi:hypothetical protein